MVSRPVETLTPCQETYTGAGWSGSARYPDHSVAGEGPLEDRCPLRARVRPDGPGPRVPRGTTNGDRPPRSMTRGGKLNADMLAQVL